MEQEFLRIARGIRKRDHSWESPSQETPQERKAREEGSSSWDKPLEYDLVAVRPRS